MLEIRMQTCNREKAGKILAYLLGLEETVSLYVEMRARVYTILWEVRRTDDLEKGGKENENDG